MATLRLAGGGMQEDSDGCCALDVVAPPQEEAYHQVIVRWRLLKRPTAALVIMVALNQAASISVARAKRKILLASAQCVT